MHINLRIVERHIKRNKHVIGKIFTEMLRKIINLFTIVNVLAEFNKIENQNGMIFTKLGKAYISKTEWHICFFYDLSDYYNQVDRLTMCAQKMTSMCEQMEKDPLCNMETTLLMQHINEMQIDKETIESFQQTHNRRRRAPLEILGKISNLLFGIMDADSAREYNEKINSLQNNENEINEFIKEQTSIIEAQVRINGKTYSEFKNSIGELADKLTNMQIETQNQTHALLERQKFESLGQIALSIISLHNKISQELRDILQDSLDGKVTNSIPAYKLKQGIKRIVPHLRSDQRIPINLEIESIYHIYKMAKLRSTLIGHKILIEIGIPLVKKENYELIKPVPIPININEATIILKPNNKYFLWNDEKTYFIPLEENELQGCRHTFNDELICTPNTPIHYNRNKICEFQIILATGAKNAIKNCEYQNIPNNNYLIQINNHNQYYCHIVKPMKISENCEDEDFRTKTIETNGILKIPSGCIFTTDDLKIEANEIKYFNDTDLIIPESTRHQWNDVKDIIETHASDTLMTDTGTILINNYDEDYNRLHGKVKELRHRQELKRMTTETQQGKKLHGISTVTIFIIILAIFSIMIYTIVKKIKPLGRMVRQINESIGDLIKKKEEDVQPTMA